MHNPIYRDDYYFAFETTAGERPKSPPVDYDLDSPVCTLASISDYWCGQNYTASTAIRKVRTTITTLPIPRDETESTSPQPQTNKLIQPILKTASPALKLLSHRDVALQSSQDNSATRKTITWLPYDEQFSASPNSLGEEQQRSSSVISSGEYARDFLRSNGDAVATAASSRSNYRHQNNDLMTTLKKLQRKQKRKATKRLCITITASLLIFILLATGIVATIYFD